MSECFRIYSENDRFISAKRLLTEDEITTVKDLCTGLGKFTIYFLKETNTRKMQELIFDMPCFLAKHKTTGYLSEEEGKSLHCSVNKQIRQCQNFRNQSEKIQLIVTNEELLSTSDRILAYVTPRPKCKLCNVFLRMGTCLQCKKAKNNPTKLF